MAILHTTYFGPIQWYQQLYRSDCVYIDGNERWQKQTIRNRCQIATANGIQTLSVPIVHSHIENQTNHQTTEQPNNQAPKTRDIRISNHGKWRREHWNALQSAYGESPFFDYYADDIRPFFTEEWEYLFDFNMAIINKMCELLDIEAQPSTINLQPPTFNPQPSTFNLQPYYQVYQQKHGFLPNLSILDLLFNMGNEAIFYL